MKINCKITISKVLLVIFITTLFYQMSFYNNTSVALGSPGTSTSGARLSTTILNLIAGGPSVTLTATVLPSSAANKAVTWGSSNPAIATVSATGIVTPLAAGMASIGVTTVDGRHTAYCIVTVTNLTVTGITLTKNQSTLKVGATVTLSPVIAPLNASNKSVNYSSNNASVATVSKAGIVSATGFGTAIISVTTVDRGFTTLFIVYVPETIDSITLSQSSLNFNIGDASAKLLATLKPGNLTLKNVAWTSSNSSIASVDSTGLVTPKFAGTTVITATSVQDSTKKATCNVTVISPVDTKIHPSGVTLNLHEKTIALGTTFTLTQIINPSNAANKAVTWSSSNKAIATVSSSGVVTPIADGNALIMVSTADGNHTDGCFVTVSESTVTGITLAKNQSTLKIGATVTITPTIAPLDASNKTVTYTSSNGSVAKVSSAGVVTATGYGTAIISVTTVDRGFTTLFIVYVPKPVAAISIILSQNSLKFNIGDAGVTLTATIKPSSFATTAVTWTSSNSSIATVDSKGKVTPVSGGTAVITATSTLDSTKKSTCSVNVVQHATGVTIH